MAMNESREEGRLDFCEFGDSTLTPFQLTHCTLGSTLVSALLVSFSPLWKRITDNLQPL